MRGSRSTRPRPLRPYATAPPRRAKSARRENAAPAVGSNSARGSRVAATATSSSASAWKLAVAAGAATSALDSPRRAAGRLTRPAARTRGANGTPARRASAHPPRARLSRRPSARSRRGVPRCSTQGRRMRAATQVVMQALGLLTQQRSVALPERAIRSRAAHAAALNCVSLAETGWNASLAHARSPAWAKSATRLENASRGSRASGGPASGGAEHFAVREARAIAPPARSVGRSCLPPSSASTCVSGRATSMHRTAPRATAATRTRAWEEARVTTRATTRSEHHARTSRTACPVGRASGACVDSSVGRPRTA